MIYIKKQRGFTLIELLIAVVVVGLLTSLAVAGYRNFKESKTLTKATQELVSNLRKAQNMAISGAEFSGNRCGFGIETDYASRPNSYRFYADTKANCSTSNDIYDGSDEEIEMIDLPTGVVIQSTSPSSADVFFKPPMPTTYINGDSTVGTVARITLESQKLSITRVVRITTAGLIEIE